ncbi:MAG TPA: hypothetical protein VH594_01170 [Trebonia sp.]
MTKTFSGSGQWNSPEFTLNCDTPAVAGDGEAITYEDNNGWRWEPS